MRTKKYRHQLTCHYLYCASRMVAGVSFVALVFIGISSLVRAITLDQVPAEKGVPLSWNAFVLKAPSTITVPITYWDQRIDPCDATTTRQFEWGKCKYWTKGALQGIVQPTLGSDGLPVPTYNNSDAAWVANHDIFTMNVIGNNPVLPSDNFYRWFHNVDGLSQRIDGRTVTFNRVGNGFTYVYGGRHIYPLDNLDGFDASDTKMRGADGKMHNFHFTGHLRIAMRISASGEERFYFSGDDDVWVFLNNQLVLDIGGLHEPLGGWFAVNPDGTVNTHIDKVSNVADRTEELTSCMKIVRTANNQCNTDFNNFLAARNVPADKTLDLGMSAGDVVYLDFFYAERSSDGSNTQITIENMDWPIPAGVTLDGSRVATTQDSEVVEFASSLANRDPEHELTIERIASHLDDTSALDPEKTNRGFLPFGTDTLYYTTTPEDDSSWSTVAVSDPAGDASGFNLKTPLTLAPQGTDGDMMYFRYAAETVDTSGKVDNVISYYTKVAGNSSIVYEDTEIMYARPVPEEPEESETPTEPENPDDADNDNNDAGNDAETPSTPDDADNADAPARPSVPSFPSTIIPDGQLSYLSPLGQVAYVPNSGIISSELSGFFMTEFATIILSQWFVMGLLLVFAGAFAGFFSLRKYHAKPAQPRTKTAHKPRTNTPQKPRTKIAPKPHAKATQKPQTARTKSPQRPHAKH